MTAAASGRWLDQVESLAREALPEPVFRYVAEGARDEITLGEAVAAWQLDPGRATRPARRPRRSTPSTDLLGTTFNLPLGIAPMTLQRAADPDGEVAMAVPPPTAGVPLVVSSNAGSTFADIAATGVTWWLQIYVADGPRRRAPSARGGRRRGRRCDRAHRGHPGAGHPLPVAGRRPRVGGGRPRVGGRQRIASRRARAGRPREGDGPRPRRHRLAGRARPGLPVVVKGVLRPDDARLCVDAGAAAVWISNHGGRQLDQVDRHGPLRRSRCARRSATRPRCTSTGECARACT